MDQDTTGSQIRMQELFSHIASSTYGMMSVITVIMLISLLKPFGTSSLNKIPTAGSKTWLGSWWGCVRFFISGGDVIQEGYQKYKGTPFKVSTPSGWMVVLSGRQLVDDFCKCRDDELNFIEAVIKGLQGDHTLGPNTLRDPWHVAVLRSKLNRNLGALQVDLKDEIVTSFNEILNLEGHGKSNWKTVPALSTVRQVVSRASNRIFLGLPLCRDPDWIDISIQFTLDVFKGATVLSLFPKSMIPFVARFTTYSAKCCKRAVKHLAPIIEARRKQMDEYGPSCLPNDFLSWLLETPEGSKCSVNVLTWRILAINLGAIHTSSNSFTQVLYNLAAHPQYIQALREEVESVIKKEGWSKDAVTKMHKIDSFLKESLRMDIVDLMSVRRQAIKDVTLSDGTIIPKGTIVIMAAQSVHLDNEFYDNATTFNPFRFADLRNVDDSGSLKHRSSTTHPGFLVFGHGIHACPGRVFATNELNTMLAHVVLTYDIKLEANAVRPRNMRVGSLNAANPTARIMFRRRMDH